jgi:hypothetical protein
MISYFLTNNERGATNWIMKMMNEICMEYKN